MSAWVARKHALAVTGWCKRTLEVKVQKGEIRSRLLPMKIRNGRLVREYEVASFPEEFRTELLRESCAIEPLAADLPFPRQPLKLAFANAEEEQAKARLETIEPALYFERRRDEYSRLRLADGTPVTSQSRMVKFLSEQHDLSERLIWERIKRFKHEGGLVALADRQRSDRGESRFAAQYPDAAGIAAFFFLNLKQSKRTAYNAIVRYAERLGLAPAEIPTYETVRSFLSSLPAYLETYARKGQKAYRENMSPYLSRGFADVWANQIWMSDHMIHDIEAMNDSFDDAEYGTPIRMRFCPMMDFRSRKYLSFSEAWEGSSRSIVTAFRLAVEQFGPPETFYCDNGKDYKKVAKGAMPAYLRDSVVAPEHWWRHEIEHAEGLGIFAHLGTAVQFCRPYHPQSKNVERSFRTVHEQFDAKFTTYTGGRPDRRPDQTTIAMADHRKLLRLGMVDRSRHPRTSFVISLLREWIEEYNASPHSGEGMEGCSPNEIFDAFRNPNQRPAPPREELALMLMERESREVRECQIRLNNQFFVGCTYEDVEALHQVNDQRVQIAFDPLDLRYVAILKNGVLIAWAEPKQLLPQSTEAGPAIAESMAQRRRLEKGTRETLASIAGAARRLGVTTDLEVLAAKVLPAAVNDGGTTVPGHVTQRKPAALRLESAAPAPRFAEEFADKFFGEEDDDRLEVNRPKRVDPYRKPSIQKREEG